MANKEILESIKKLREITGVGFKDCKIAIDENNGDLDKSVEFLRKKGIAKASKKMSRTASEGLVLAHQENNEVSIIEVNSETDFVAKNKDFISFCKEVSKLNHKSKGDVKVLENSIMKNSASVKNNIVDLISKIGEKITITRTKFLDNTDKNFYYVHGAVEKNIGKIISAIKIKNLENTDLGIKLAMHIAASNPLALDKSKLDKKIIDKETEIIKAELINSGKKQDMIEKIASGKLNKFISDNTLINQVWIMDPKKKVSDILKENSTNNKIEIKEFVRIKVGEGV